MYIWGKLSQIWATSKGIKSHLIHSYPYIHNMVQKTQKNPPLKKPEIPTMRHVEMWNSLPCTGREIRYLTQRCSLGTDAYFWSDFWPEKNVGRELLHDHWTEAFQQHTSKQNIISVDCASKTQLEWILLPPNNIKQYGDRTVHKTYSKASQTILSWW